MTFKKLTPAKKRYLFNHPESDSLFEEYLTEEEVEEFFCKADGAMCDDVTGEEHWEKKFKEESRQSTSIK